MASVRLTNLKKSFGTTEVIKAVDLEVADGEFVVFVGPSGCGKSTLLRMIAGLEDITGGDLFIDGKHSNETEPRDRGIAMVFQSYALYPHLTVFENLSFRLSLSRAPKAEIKERVHETARILQLNNLLDRKPAQLSGGQRQRVAIGRAIIREPQVFLFDEPLSNLDAALRMDMRMEIARLHKELGVTMIYVTHDQVEAMTLADRIMVLEGGVVQQIGAPIDIYRKPANRFVAGFIGSPRMNFLDVTVAGVSEERVTIQSPTVSPITLEATGFAAGDRAVLGVRPQQLHAHGDESLTGTLRGTVQRIERLGSETIVSLEFISSERALAAIPHDEVFVPGSEIELRFDPDAVHLFPAN
jgi:multiple sugar transport system ATP-binding protein